MKIEKHLEQLKLKIPTQNKKNQQTIKLINEDVTNIKTKMES